MKVLVLIAALAAGFAVQNEGCVAESVAWQAAQAGQIAMSGSLEV